ncbi:proline-rich protein 36-like [Panicum virgatum]|uniref:proline-rich protein 36-like n=1 Tax=Panicum virgatum TaxID=38727 RepID=UPI0019D4FA84|nr:proline-rich protein 36-like [Panicum virgatum]
MWACCNVILVMFPDFRDGFIWELLNSRNPVPKGIIGLAYRKVLGQECIGTSIPCSECLLIGVESRLGLPKSLSSSPACLSALFSAADASPCRPPLWATSPRHILPASTPRVARSLPTALLCSRWCLPALPRCLEPPCGRHLNAAVASPLQNPEHRSLLFPHSFARSLLRKPQNAAAPSVVAGELRSAAADPLPPSPGSNPRHHELRLAPLKLLGPSSPPNRHQSAAAIHLNAGKQAAAANPPFQARSAPTDPAISTTRVLRISQASPPPQSAAAERSPASCPSRRRTSPRGTPNPTTPSPKKTTFGFVSASSSFPPTQTSPPVSRGAGKGRPNPALFFPIGQGLGC